MTAFALILKKYWVHILITIIVLSILIYIYQKGKSSGEEGKPEIIALPKDVAGQPLNEFEARQIRELTNLLYNDLSGLASKHDVILYRRLVNLGDKLFAGVYDDFNNVHFKEGKGTLKQWIDDDWFIPFSEQKNLKDNNIMPRFARLNLV